MQQVNFPEADSVEIEWEPASALSASNFFVGAYPSFVTVAKATPARAVIHPGDAVPLRVELKNRGQGKLMAGEARLTLSLEGQSFPTNVPPLAPGETWRAEWPWTAPVKAGRLHGLAKLDHPRGHSEEGFPIEVLARPRAGALRTLQNDFLKLEFVRLADGFAYANVFARQDRTNWAHVAVWKPLLRFTQSDKEATTWEFRPKAARGLPAEGVRGEALEFSGPARDVSGVEFTARLRVSLVPGRPLVRVHYEWQAGKRAPAPFLALLGPNLYVGEGTTGAAKTWGLFPGLEYLYGAESSSSERDFAPNLADRRTPHPHKITVPLMAVTLGPDSQSPPENMARFFAPDSLKDQPRLAGADFKSQISNLKSPVTVALLWDPLQKWDGTNAFPSARFSSPNTDEGMANHRLALFLPSTPDFVQENSDRAPKPYTLAPGQKLTLDATLVALPGPATVALREWVTQQGGLPKPHEWPRPFQEELDVCRAGFLQTVGDPATGKFRHCIDWGLDYSPGMMTLLWVDAHLAAKPEARRASRERVELAVRNLLAERGPGGLISEAGCHILRWEFPFHYGHLPEAMAALDGHVRNLIRSQHPDGGWRYEAHNEQMGGLGQASDAVLGTCANRAAAILRFARITGDAEALAAGQKALRFMERFRVPRGGQTWECPMYEPDILPAGYAVQAYLDGWRCTGDARWLHDAVYWAETGVAFNYLWTLPDKPMMLGASIPVFGSTFYTHSWLGVPVQWCGLVYVRHVRQLAETLERAPLPHSDSPLPLALDFTPADWRRLGDLLTVSAMYQQFADGPRLGTYPDSISDFTRRNGAFINPENILLNLLAMQGHDPDVQTARLTGGRGKVVISSGARIEKAQRTATGVKFALRGFAGEPSHTLIAGLKPKAVAVNDHSLAPLLQPLKREPGWWWDEASKRVYVTAPAANGAVVVEITGE